MRTHLPAEDGAALARLAAQVDRVERQLAAIGALRADLDSHGTALQRLTEATRRTATSRPRAAAITEAGEDAGPPEWLTVTDPARAIAWLNELWMWVARVWDRYHPLPVCWPWHPPVVAELLACRQSWLAATAHDATADGLSNWHDRWRPAADGRIHKVMLPGCIRADGLHLDEGGRWTVDPAGVDALAHWWATTHGTTRPPGLTPATEAHR